MVSDGDCLDSNGDLTVNGGTLDLTCNGNGNTALDCSGSYTNNGGSVTTNDGSETNSGGRSGNRLEEEREPLPSGRPKADKAWCRNWAFDIQHTENPSYTNAQCRRN